MKKILQNIKETIIKKLDTEKIPHLTSAKIEECTYTINRYSFYSHYSTNTDWEDRLSIYLHVEEKKRRLSITKMIKEKRFTEKYFLGDLSIDSNKDKRKYKISSDEYNILSEIYVNLKNYLCETEKTSLLKTAEMTKTDISLVRNENVTHNF